MGIVDNISMNKFPKQGSWLGKRAKVIFRYDDPIIMGTIVRDDSEEPWRTIISLDDGRVVLATECMYSPVSEEVKK